MEHLRFIPIKLSLVVVAGILIGHYLQPPPLFALLAAVLSILFLMAVHLWHSHRRFTTLFALFACATTMLIGLSAYSLSQNKLRKHHYTNHDIEGVKLFHVKVREVLKPNRFSFNYVAEVMSMDSTMVNGAILLRLPLDEFSRECNVDDEILVAAMPERPSGPLNPHQFDYREYLARKGIFHQLQPTCEAVIYLDTPHKTWKGTAAHLRKVITQQLIAAGFSLDELSVVQALLLGQRQQLPDDVYDNYKDAGAVHILAVSGLHIGILLWLLHFILKPLEHIHRGKTIKLLFLVCILWSYAFLAGLSASIIRAVAMFSFVAYALYLNRPSNTFNILALSMFFILLTFDPRLLFQAGFQMSYAAVFAILLIFPGLQSAFSPRFWFARKAWQLFSVSLAAQLGVLPISLYYFHQFPGLFFVTNLLVVPFLGIVLATGFLIAFLSVLRLLPLPLANGYNELIRFMNQLVAWVADKESFLFREIPFDGVMVVLAYVAIISLCRFLYNISAQRLASFLLAILAIQLWQVARVVLVNHREEVWLLHQSRNTLLFHQVGSRLTVITPYPKKAAALISDFRVGAAIREIQYVPISTNYLWESGMLTLLDEKNTFSEKSIKPQYLLLRNSPKINLDRVLNKISAAVVIADGSNYTSFISRWEKSCIERGIPFHDTASRGAYPLLLR